MPTTHFPITATSSNSVPAPSDKNRNSLYIRNYSTSADKMFVAFGQVATLGTNGELEVLPGYEYSFGSTLLPNNTTPLKGYPTESVNVISANGATGCIITT